MGSMLRIKADVQQLANVRQFIREQALRAGADRRATDDIVQAVDESVTNSIIHGYRGGQGEVEVEFERDGRSLVVRLRDHAPPFDPTLLSVPDTTAPLERRRPHGMGVFLARELTDSVKYQRTDSSNELTLIKELMGQAGGGTC